VGKKPSPQDLKRNTASVMPEHSLWNVPKLLPFLSFAADTYITALYFRLEKMTILLYQKNTGTTQYGNLKLPAISKLLTGIAIRQTKNPFSISFSLFPSNSFGKHFGNHFPTNINKIGYRFSASVENYNYKNIGN